MATIQLPQTLRERVKLAARAKGMRVADVYRVALERYCDSENVVLPVSRFDGIIGAGDGEHGAVGANSEMIYAKLLQGQSPTKEPTS